MENRYCDRVNTLIFCEETTISNNKNQEYYHIAQLSQIKHKLSMDINLEHYVFGIHRSEITFRENVVESKRFGILT